MSKTIPDIQNEIAQLYTALDEAALDLDFPTPTLDYGDSDVEFPAFTGELAEEAPALTITAVTTGQLNGTGSFDQLMQVFQKYIEREFQANRISGTEYSKIYMETLALAAQQGAQFVLAANSAAWQNRLLRAQAQQAEYTKIMAKLEAKRALFALYQANADMLTAQIQAYIGKANLINSKMGLSTSFEQIQVMEESIDTARAQTKDTLQNGSPVAGVLKQQRDLVSTQIDQIEEQIINLTKQRDLLCEQVESQRAQTTDARTDGLAVTGLLGAQRELYKEQQQAYTTDAKAKVVKMALDTWTTRKGVGDAIEPPVNLDVDSGGLGRGNLDAVVKSLLEHVQLPNV